MEENINTSVESQDVAEPETDVTASEETQEVAETAPEANDSNESTEQPTHQRTEQDAAFAEMRRNNQAQQKQIEMMQAALSRYFDGESVEDLVINANAYAEQVTPDEYRQTFERDREYEDLKARNAQLEEELLNQEVDRLMREGLREVQAIDPNVKSLDDLGRPFADLIANGVPTKEAYYATKAMELKEKILAPDVIGRVSDSKAERDYYTSEELDHLTDEEMDANWDKVMRSMGRL